MRAWGLHQIPIFDAIICDQFGFQFSGAPKDLLMPLSTVIVLLVLLCLFFVLGGQFADTPKHSNRSSGALVLIFRAQGLIC